MPELPDVTVYIEPLEALLRGPVNCPTCQTGGKLLADRALSRLLRGDWPKTLAELEEMKAERRVKEMNPASRALMTHNS